MAETLKAAVISGPIASIAVSLTQNRKIQGIYCLNVIPPLLITRKKL
jgi:hypothetical protein